MRVFVRLVAFGVAVGVAAAGAIGAAVVTPAAAAGRADQLYFSVSRFEVDEGAGRAVLEVRRPATTALEETEAAFITVDEGATSPDDYMSTRGRLRLHVGATSGSVQVVVVDDAEHEPLDESFAVRLLDPDDPSRVVDEVTIVINDNDPAPRDYVGGDRASGASGSGSGTVSGASAQAGNPQAVAQRPSVRVRRVPARPATPKVTPFRLQAPDDGTSGSVPVPAHATPTTAAGLLAGLLLARVAAELWYLRRKREI